LDGAPAFEDAFRPGAWYSAELIPKRAAADLARFEVRGDARSLVSW